MAAEWVYERACVFFGGENVICVPWRGWELHADFIIFHSVPGVCSASCESTFVRDAAIVRRRESHLCGFFGATAPRKREASEINLLNYFCQRQKCVSHKVKSNVPPAKKFHLPSPTSSSLRSAPRYTNSILIILRHVKSDAKDSARAGGGRAAD